MPETPNVFSEVLQDLVDAETCAYGALEALRRAFAKASASKVDGALGIAAHAAGTIEELEHSFHCLKSQRYALSYLEEQANRTLEIRAVPAPVPLKPATDPRREACGHSVEDGHTSRCA